MFKKVLVPIDVSRKKDTDRLCETALNLGAEEIRLVSVIPDFGTPLVASFFPSNAQDGLKQEIKTMLEELVRTHFSGTEASYSLRQGKRAKEILAEAADWAPDLILIGCRRKDSNGGKRSLGSCSLSVADRANSPVLLMK